MTRTTRSVLAIHTSILSCVAVLGAAGHRPAFAQQEGTHAQAQVPAQAQAQAQGQAQVQAQVQVLPPVEVVGSRVKRTDWETPAPVEVITQEEITRSGATSLREVLNSISAQMNGSLQDEAVGTGWAAGSSTVSLRGLGSSATLVLLNGRRFVASPFVDPGRGQSQVYNINIIPLTAIERIEVLKSGASAIYGSDAVGGVVNIVMRSEYRGAEAGVRYSFDDGGNFGNRRVHGIIGFGDPDTENRYSGYLLLAHSKRQQTNMEDAHGIQESELTRLFSRDRPISTLSYPPNYYTESSPGSNSFTRFFARDARCPAQLVTAAGLCGYNTDRDSPTVAALEVNSIVGRLNFPVRPGLSFFSEFGLARVESLYPFSPERVLQTGETYFAPDGRRFFWRWILPAGHPDNPTTTPVAVRYRFSDLGLRSYGQVADNKRLLLGAKGQAAGWDWETGFLYNYIDLHWTSKGFINLPAFQDATTSLAYRPFGSNSPETIARMSPPLFDDGWTGLLSWDVKGSRKLTNMAGGPLMLATGAEVRRESIEVKTDPRTRNGESVNIGSSDADASRRITAVFGELSIPFARNVETQVAVRSDRYSDFGSSTNPQFAIKWKPISSLALRAGYARGFRVPSLAQSTGSNVTTFATISDPLRCGRPGATAEDCSRPISSLISNNPDLEAEKSVGQTLGIVFAPTPNVDVSLDYFRIDQKKETGLLSSTFIIRTEAQFPGQVVRDPDPSTWLPGVPNSGPIISTLRRYTNLGETVTSGVDMQANLRTSLGARGNLSTRLSGTYVHKYKTKIDSNAPFIESQGYYGPYGGQPLFKGSLSSTWSYRGFALTGRVNHLSGWHYGTQATPCFSSNAAFRTGYDCVVRPWTTIDVSLGYTEVKNLDLGLSVRNIGNKAAPIDPDYPTLGYNPTFFNPYGRYFTVWLNYKFK